MKIENVKIDKNFEGTYGPAVTFTVITEKGSVELLEWLRGGWTERTDSHVRINQSEALREILDEDTSLSDVLDAVDALIDASKK